MINKSLKKWIFYIMLYNNCKNQNARTHTFCCFAFLCLHSDSWANSLKSVSLLVCGQWSVCSVSLVVS